jgi:hypothetical protein
MMKKIFLLALATLVLTPSMKLEAKTLQLGVDVVVPYQSDTRLVTLGGAHGVFYIHDSFAVNLTTLFGIEDAPGDAPIYFSPGVTYYFPVILNPFLAANVPVLVNNGGDIGVQGGAGLLWNIILGVGLKYQIDYAYYFDADQTVINWVHAGAVFTF